MRRQCVKLDSTNSNSVNFNSGYFNLKIISFTIAISNYFSGGFEIAGFICTCLGFFFSFCM